jgi:hypothetical protein
VDVGENSFNLKYVYYFLQIVNQLFFFSPKVISKVFPISKKSRRHLIT